MTRRLLTSALAGVALVIGTLTFATPASAVVSGTIVANNNGTATVSYTATANEIVTLFICPAGTVPCGVVSARYSMVSGAQSPSPLPSPTTVDTNSTVTDLANAGATTLLPAGDYVFTLFAPPATLPSDVSVTIGGGGGGNTPSPPTPPSAPSAAQARAGNGEVTVSWTAPASQGSFAVSNYQVQAGPSGQGCLVPATATTCRIAGLRNGTPYSFKVRALNGRGWSAWADAGTVTPTPTPEPDASIMITGSRSGNERVARVSGQTTGLEVAMLQSMVRLSSQTEFTAGAAVQVDPKGEFTWKRRVAVSVALEVYFTAGEITSNTVIIASKR